MIALFNEIIYRPLLNLLFLVYNNTWADLGIAIVIVTVIIRTVLLPLFYKSAKDQTIMQKIAPRIREIQQEHKENKEKQVQEIMNVYKEHKVNPFAGFLLLFIQLPILIGLYQVFFKGFSQDVLNKLYAFITHPTVINYSFLGVFDLSKKSVVLVIMAAVAQYIQSALLFGVAKKNRDPKKELSTTERVSKQMMVVGPLLTIVILYNLPSAIAIYWLTTSVFSVIQQIVINRKINKNNEKNTGDSN